MGKAASGANTKYYFTEEVNGEIAATAPVFYPIRFNTSSLTRETTQIDSEEINSIRQRPPSRQGTYAIAGEMLSEMSAGSFDRLIAGVMQSEWNGGAAVDGAQLFFLSADNSINDPLNRFVTRGFVDTDVVDCVGASDPGNVFTGATATTVTAGKIILTGPTIVDEQLGFQILINTPGDSISIGSFIRTYTIVEVHDDVGVTTAYKGNRINEMPVAAPLNSAAQLTFGYIGELAIEYTFPVDAVFVTGAGTPMMVTTSGYLEEDSVAINYATDYSFTYSNNMEALFSLFQREAYAVANGVATLAGALSAYLPDDALLQKYLAETTVAHEVEFIDNEVPQNWYKFLQPNVNYTQLDKPVDGPGAVLQNYTTSAGYQNDQDTMTITRGTTP
jgi:hypothetical protein